MAFVNNGSGTADGRSGRSAVHIKNIWVLVFGALPMFSEKLLFCWQSVGHFLVSMGRKKDATSLLICLLFVAVHFIYDPTLYRMMKVLMMRTTSTS